MDRIVPKSVMKSGVKLPSMTPSQQQHIRFATANSEPDITETGAGATAAGTKGKFGYTTTPRLGKNVFRPRFSRFGDGSRMQQHVDSSINPRDRVRCELAKVLKDARDRSKEDLGGDQGIDKEEQSSIIYPRQALELRDSSLSKLSPEMSPPPSKPPLVSKSCADLAVFNSTNICCVCRQSVYPLEKIEPVEGVQYHPKCFRCAECGSKLSLMTFCRNPMRSPGDGDTKVYCRNHQPKMDKVMICRFSTRRREFPAFKLSWSTPD